MTFVRWFTFDKHDPIDPHNHPWDQRCHTRLQQGDRRSLSQQIFAYVCGALRQALGENRSRALTGHVPSASSVWQERETFILYSWDEFALWKNLGAIGASLGLGGEQWQEPFHPGSHAPKFCVLPHHGTQHTVYRPVCPPLASELVSEPLRKSACVLITFINPPPSRGAGNMVAAQ